MKRFVFAGVSLLALAMASTAGAADLSRRGVVPVAAPIPVAVAYNWSGFYAGLVAGVGFGNSRWNDAAGTTGDFDVTGGLVGGTLGYNVQNGQFVFGVETDLSWSGMDGSTTVTCALGCTTENTWLGTARGRVGIAVDRLLPYLTAGLAYGNVEARTPGFPPASETSIGWTVGAGAEVALGGNWTAKGEYLYVDLGETSCGVANCGGVGGTDVEFNSHVLRAGLNYRF